MPAPANPRQRVLDRHLRKEGVRPITQDRARQTRDRLLESGRALLQTRDLDQLSIVELSSAMGLSVGSFYGRFRDKAAYFEVLQELVTEEWLSRATAELRSKAFASATPRQAMNRIAVFLVKTLSADRGFVRAAIRHAPSLPAGWSPMMRTGAHFMSEVETLMLHSLVHLPSRTRRSRIRFAMQIMYGTLLNAILHDPGPLKLDDPRFARELGHAASRYLALADAPTGGT
jgi:AcrR family transcriptional regulator